MLWVMENVDIVVYISINLYNALLCLGKIKLIQMIEDREEF